MSKIKTNAEVVAIVGERFAKTLLKLRKGSWTRLPYSIIHSTKKPSFGLNDGGTLHCYLVDLTTMEVAAEHYGGSADTILNHKKEQLSEGATPPEDLAYLFIETSWNGRNMSWFVTVVTTHRTQISA